MRRESAKANSGNLRLFAATRAAKRHRFVRVAAALVYNFAVFRGIRGCAGWRTIGYP